MQTMTRIVSTKPSSSAHAVSSLRSQAACVRMLLDEIERVVPSGQACEGLSRQLVEELARLGCRTLEAAEALLEVVDEPRRCA